MCGKKCSKIQTVQVILAVESEALVSKFKKVQSHQVYVRVTRPALLDLARLLT